MKYAITLTREQNCREVKVSHIKPCRDDIQPHKFTRRKRWGTDISEALLVFDTLDQAQAAAKHEEFAARLSAMPQEELLAVAKDLVVAYKQAGISRPALARLLNESSNTIEDYTLRPGRSLNHRILARILMLTKRLIELQNEMDSILPDRYACAQTGKPRTYERVTLAPLRDFLAGCGIGNVP